MQKGFEEVNLHGCVSGVLAVPVIGENGNWFIGNDDTGVVANGRQSTDTQSGASPIITDLESKAVKTLTIALPTPYEDADYAVALGNNSASVQILFTVTNKSKSSFTVAVYNGNVVTVASCSFDWITRHN